MTDVVLALHRITWTDYEHGMGNWATPQLLSTLARSPAVRQLLVADPFRSVAVLAKRVRRAGLPTSDRLHHVAPLRLRRQDPTSIAALHRTYARWDAWTRTAARRHGLRDPAVITVNPLVAGMSGLRWASRVTYHGTDDWPAAPRLEAWWPAFREAYQLIAARGHVVTGVSGEIVRRIGPGGASAVIPNGIDPREWLQPPPPPSWLESVPRPRGVYIGTLDRRIDIVALRAARSAFPGGLVLIGPQPDPAHLEPLRSLPDVIVRPPVARDELVGITAACDVGLVPHSVDVLTDAMSPLKVFEYLAAGLPVASTPLAGVRELGHDRVVCAEASRYGDGVMAALALGRTGEAERRRWIERNSWECRHEALLRLALPSIES